MLNSSTMFYCTRRPRVPQKRYKKIIRITVTIRKGRSFRQLEARTALVVIPDLALDRSRPSMDAGRQVPNGWRMTRLDKTMPLKWRLRRNSNLASTELCAYHPCVTLYPLNFSLRLNRSVSSTSSKASGRPDAAQRIQCTYSGVSENG